ncbi:MAG: type II toxin-antitoxin system HicA family toxin [Gallionellaceae bacterium]|nr:MAG: type II toxin-antitoxin system HicA family toxin [Gallionellaceae bacterium]
MRSYKHPTKSGRVTVPHPRKDTPLATLRSIYRQAGLDWKERK